MAVAVCENSTRWGGGLQAPVPDPPPLPRGLSSPHTKPTFWHCAVQAPAKNNQNPGARLESPFSSPPPVRFSPSLGGCQRRATTRMHKRERMEYLHTLRSYTSIQLNADLITHQPHRLTPSGALYMRGLPRTDERCWFGGGWQSTRCKQLLEPPLDRCVGEPHRFAAQL